MPKFASCLAAVCAFALFTTPAFTTPAYAQSITGVAVAIDGDTLDVTGQHIRLYGIDAPGLKQDCQRDGVSWPCGGQARDLLASMVANRETVCRALPSTSSPIVARCAADGVDLAEAMVASGLAIALISGEAVYADLGARVQARKLGLWAGTFENPEAWRKAHPEASPRPVKAERAVAPIPNRSTRKSDPGCTIKGNWSRRQREYIYYLPGMKYYDETRPEEIFCSEDAALKAGYRRSRGG